MLVSMNTETHAARILTRKVRKSGSEGLALLLMLSGIFLMLFTWWPIGFLCIIGAFFADAKYGSEHYCPACGNDVAPTSRICPICGNALAAAKTSIAESSTAVIISLLAVVVIVTAFFLFTSIRSDREARAAREAKDELEWSAKEQQRQAEAAKAEREQREQMAREIASRSESIDPKVEAALDMAKKGGTEIPPLPPIVPPNQSGSLPPPGLLYR